MKTRRLPEIDLARIAPLPRETKATELRRVRDGKPRISYNPMRSHSHDILNVQPEMFGPVAHTDWAVVEKLICKASKSEPERKANLGVARALHHYAEKNVVRAREHRFPSLNLTTGGLVSFWLNMILARGDLPVIPFIDPRRSHGLTAEGRKFVFSMMHENIRRADPDLEEVALSIIQFTGGDDEERSAILRIDHGIELYDHWALNEMISETYDLWLEVLEDGQAETRRKSGRRGTLL